MYLYKHGFYELSEISNSSSSVNSTSGTPYNSTSGNLYNSTSSNLYSSFRGRAGINIGTTSVSINNSSQYEKVAVAMLADHYLGTICSYNTNSWQDLDIYDQQKCGDTVYEEVDYDDYDNYDGDEFDDNLDFDDEFH